MTGAWSLLRLALRRDRVMLPLIVLGFAGTAALSAGATVGLYPTEASRVAAAHALNATSALIALYGRIYDPRSIAAIAMLKLSGFGTALVGLVAAILTVRHSRTEEESGRLELIGAAAVGRLAPLGSALALAGIASLAVGVCTAAGLIAAGLPAAGSIAFGLSWTGAGVVFAGLGAVAAQLSTSARTAGGLAASAVGVAYVLRAVGDARSAAGVGWESWASPIGWAQQVRPYAGERWWVLGLMAAATVVLAGAALALAARRDLGAGLLPDRTGPASASPRLAGPIGLLWRLERGGLIAWTVACAGAGAAFGGVASGVGGLLTSAQSRRFIDRLGGAHGLIDAFLVTELGFMGLIAAAYGIQATLRLRGEETGGRAEPVLAGAVGRVRWAGGGLGLALLGSAALLLASGVAAAAARLIEGASGREAASVIAGALVQLPAIAVMTGLAIALFGLLPQRVGVAWAALAAVLVLGEIGRVLGLPGWVVGLSPFAHVPRIPGGSFQPGPVAALLAVAAALSAVGLAGVRRRDLT